MDSPADGGNDGTGRVTRRRVLLTSATVATAGVLAGCSSGDGSDDSSDGGGSTSSGDTPEATETPNSTPPGADILGGPDDLQSSAEVRATVLEEDQGAGRYVFTPAVVWLEPGGTVFWNFEETDHTVTVYHPQYDKPNRIPEGVETPFSSEFASSGEPGTGFNFVFDVEGVWNYFCKPHEDRGMAGMVIVGEPQGGGGTAPPTDVESANASEKLARLLEVADIGESSDVVDIPRYEFSEGESYTFETLFRTNDGTRESTETWRVTAVDGDDVTVEVTSEVDGETTTQTFSGTHETIYDAAARQLTFDAFSVARSPLRVAEMGDLSTGNSFTVQRSQFPNQDTIDWSTATVEVAGETTFNGVTCTEFTLRPDDADQTQTACVADDYPFAVSLRVEQAGTTTMELTLTDSARR
ncbi:cupredoxin domain-containing protein [Natrinema halophilum]|uniref:cupredoxin domain-containing protein n=1 Tax=Natrinema halophilum TaxID=1699371 RepID=UPI001F2B58FF|nr:plastocyanin/azurin family copper-binding protein [Natrinema halophilum]UHQ96355.1 plastocyanin/azurin family copper-binding protein [Natrinema halophilum]